MCVNQQHQENRLGFTQEEITTTLLSHSALAFILFYQDILVQNLKFLILY